MRAKLFLVFNLCLITALEAASPDWHQVRSILGREGEVDQGILRISYPRTDLKIMKDGLPVSAELVLDSWYGFWPMDDGTMMLMGDTCVTEGELSGVLDEIHRQNLDLSALHNHLTGEVPKIYFLHLSGRGDAAELARKAKAVLSRTAAPSGKEDDKDREKPKTKTPSDWSPVIAILGKPAEMEGDIVEYGYRRIEPLSMDGHRLPSTDALETAPEVKLQMLEDGRAITYGEMILTANEVGPVFHVLSEHGIAVTALHNHMVSEEPRLIFMHWWAVGKPQELATGIRAAVAKMNIRAEAESN